MFPKSALWICLRASFLVWKFSMSFYNCNSVAWRNISMFLSLKGILYCGIYINNYIYEYIWTCICSNKSLHIWIHKHTHIKEEVNLKTVGTFQGLEGGNSRGKWCNWIIISRKIDLKHYILVTLFKRASVTLPLNSPHLYRVSHLSQASLKELDYPDRL